MVISRTSALEVIIQAVSPESIFGAAANAGAVVSAKAPRLAAMPRPVRFTFEKFIEKLP